MIKHLYVLTFMSAAALHGTQASDWLQWEVQEGHIKPEFNTSVQSPTTAGADTMSNQMKPINQGGLELCTYPFGDEGTLPGIYIHQNINFPKITRKSLRNCFGIKKIRLSSNPGLRFQENAFVDLTTLEVLVLEHVEYRHVTQELTRNLKSLRNLTISACGVRLIDQNAFSALENLEYLDLSYNNLTLVYRLFGNLGKLKSLDLFGNQLTTFPWDELTYLGGLEWLVLGKNNIVHYNVDKIAKYLPKLKGISVNFQTEMPCSIVNEMRDDFRMKAAHVKVYEGVGSTGEIQRCPLQARVIVPQSSEVYGV